MSDAANTSRIDSAEVHSIWGYPDMTVIDGGRRKAPAMPAAPFGPLWGLLGDLADSAGAPVDYVALSVVTTSASLIGGKRRVRPWPTSDWSEPCILWAALVGDPSMNKSPAIDRATDALRSIEGDHADAHAYALADYEAVVERAKAERAAWSEAVKTATKDGLDTPALPPVANIPDEPQRRRCLVQDATTEALGVILSGNPAGTLHLRDELAGWFEGFDRYSPGGRTFWLEAYGGRSFVVDRLKNGAKPLRIPFNGVSVLGGIQPDRLSEALLSGADDGLVSRFLWAWPERKPFARPVRSADTEQLEAIYRRLDSLAWGISPSGDSVPVTLPLDADAADLYDQWREENDAQTEDGGPLYRGALGKLSGAVLRLSLVFELLRWAMEPNNPEPASVSRWSVGCALTYADDYAKPMALRVFGDAALPPVERNAAVLARYIRKHKPAKVNSREVSRNYRLPGLKDAAAIKDALEWLTDADWLRPAPSRDGGSAGRNRADFLVNPRLKDAA